MADNENVYEVVIIGGGVSGLAAAMYAARFKLKTAVIAESPGGTIVWTDDVSNYPGFKQVTGMELADKLKDHAKEYNVKFFNKKATKITRCKNGAFDVSMGERLIKAKSLIFATGSQWKELGVPGEQEFKNKGVHYCALCDGAVYGGKTLAIVGGSDSAAKDALVLTQHGKKVYIIYRKEKIRPEPVNQDKIDKKIEEGKIEIINNANVTEIVGEKGGFVKKVILDRKHEGSNELVLDAVFVAIGHLPLSELAKAIGVKLNEKNEIMIDRSSKTNVKGVFAAGDVVDTHFKQAITGVAEGVHAAYSAYTYLGENEIV